MVDWWDLLLRLKISCTKQAAGLESNILRRQTIAVSVFACSLAPAVSDRCRVKGRRWDGCDRLLEQTVELGC